MTLKRRQPILPGQDLVKLLDDELTDLYRQLREPSVTGYIKTLESVGSDSDGNVDLVPSTGIAISGSPSTNAVTITCDLTLEEARLNGGSMAGTFNTTYTFDDNETGFWVIDQGTVSAGTVNNLIGLWDKVSSPGITDNLLSGYQGAAFTNVFHVRSSGAGYFAKQVTIAEPDGIAPLSVVSQTIVTNLSSDFLDGYHATAFLRYLRDSANTDVAPHVTGGYVKLSSSDSTVSVLSAGSSIIDLKVANVLKTLEGVSPDVTGNIDLIPSTNVQISTGVNAITIAAVHNHDGVYAPVHTHPYVDEAGDTMTGELFMNMATPSIAWGVGGVQHWAWQEQDNVNLVGVPTADVMVLVDIQDTPDSIELAVGRTGNLFAKGTALYLQNEGTALNDSVFGVYRGASATPARLYWDEANDRWQVNPGQASGRLLLWDSNGLLSLDTGNTGNKVMLYSTTHYINISAADAYAAAQDILILSGGAVVLDVGAADRVLVRSGATNLFAVYANGSAKLNGALSQNQGNFA